MARQPFHWRAHHSGYLDERAEDELVELLFAQARELLEYTAVHEGFTPRSAALSLDSILGLYVEFERGIGTVKPGPDTQGLKHQLERVNHQLIEFAESVLRGLSQLFAASRAAESAAVSRNRSQYDSNSLRSLSMETARRLSDHFSEYQAYYKSHERDRVVRALYDAHDLVRQAEREPMAWEFKRVVVFFEGLAHTLVESGEGGDLDRVEEWIDRVRAIEWEDPQYAEKEFHVASSMRFIEQVVHLVRNRKLFFVHAAQIRDASRQHVPLNDTLRESIAFVRRFPEVLQRSALSLMQTIREVEEGVPTSNVTEFADGLTWASGVLRVSPNATATEVKQAFRQRIMKLHPDLVGPEKEHLMRDLLRARALFEKSQKGR